MQYEWDENKAQVNLFKHGVDFISAEEFVWDSAIETVDDRFDYDEERWIALGFIDVRLYVLVYVYWPTSIRLISLRKANKRERDYYEKQTFPH